MRHIYVFSGLGADERVLKDLDLSGFDVTFIAWIPPLPSETIEHYAQRLARRMTSPKPVLMGLSFGGIMAVEVAKLIETEHVILIASAKTRHEIPFYFRLAGQLRLHKLLPTSLLKWPNSLSDWFFGARRKEDKQLLAAILRDTDGRFLRWAIDRIVYWTNQTYPQHLTHIHGNKDKILPLRYVASDLIVADGGHLMTLNQAPKLTQLIRSLL